VLINNLFIIPSKSPLPFLSISLIVQKIPDISIKTSSKTFKYWYIPSIYMIKQEQLIRKVTKIGNGAHIFAPKEWLGEEVIIIKSAGTLKERILSLLKDQLEHIEGIYLYGSYAREDHDLESDIDLLIISDKKQRIKSPKYEIISISKDNIEKAIKSNPILMYSLLSEARPIMNSPLLERLKDEYKPKKRYLETSLKEISGILKINKEAIEDCIHEKRNVPDGIVYSIVLRLRELHLARLLLSGKPYNKKGFLDLIGSKAYSAYLRIKRDEKELDNANPGDIAGLIELSEKWLKELKD